ncbi:MAG: sulfatase-like hydrolase/transferase [Planctomycetes bacterium]|nr:sulfatase-like hydrolase/transferase [Planctomycetota bacterium]
MTIAVPIARRLRTLLLAPCIIPGFQSLTDEAAIAHEGPPNIVLIMADDLGYENLGCYGSKVYATPNIDRLAASGMRFDHAHAQPICTPSRVQLMTGIYNNRNYIRFGLLDPAARTFASVLKEAGYATCIAGKWQLEGSFDGPRKFGFDHYCLWQLTRRPSRYPNPGLEIDGEEKDFKEGQFGPDLVCDYICDFLEKHRDPKTGPFLVYYPMIAAHWPFVPTPDHPDWDPKMWRDAKDEPGGFKEPKYWDAMVRYTDKMVGRIVDKLEALGLRDNTLVIFTGDNGTYTSITSRFRGRDYRGGKGSPKDNGTHVGFVASWPAVIEPKTTSDELVDLADVFPTLLDVAGVSHPPDPAPRIDGISLAPVFRGKARSPAKDHIFCWYERNGVRAKASQHVRDQRFKLYADGRFYDTVVDPLEERNLATQAIDTSHAPAFEVMLRLQEALAKHVAVTRACDEEQKRKRRAHAR